MHRKKLSKTYVFYLSALDRMTSGKKVNKTNAGQIQVQREIGIDFQNLISCTTVDT